MNDASAIRYAGFWKRFGAYSIDASIVQLLAILIGWLLGSVAMAQGVDPNIQQLIDMGWLQPSDADSVQSLLKANGASGTGGWFSMGDVFILTTISAIYNIWFVAGRWQATPGKRMAGIMVVMASGARLNLFQSAVRHAACGLSFLTFFLGYAMIGFSREKVAMHDAVVGSRVIYGKTA